MTRAEGAVDWSKNPKFKFSKLVLMDIAHRNGRKTHPMLTLPNISIELTSPDTLGCTWINISIEAHTLLLH